MMQLAVVGAAGLVGQSVLELLLAERRFQRARCLPWMARA
jgi:aspartate-semialdehyde dehydrogenase